MFRLENTIRRYEINIYVHDKAILKTDVGMSICSDSSTIWDWAWNSCFGSLTWFIKIHKFLRKCSKCQLLHGTDWNISTLKQVVQPPAPWQRGQAVCVSFEKYWISQNIEKQFSWVNTREFFVKSNIFQSFHGIFPLFPHFSLRKKANFGPFVIFGDVLISRPNLMSETETGPNLSQIHNSLPFQLSSFLPLLPF